MYERTVEVKWSENTYGVASASPEGYWIVYRGGSIVDRSETKSEAIKEARKRAKDGGYTLVVENKDGSTSERTKYEPSGSDMPRMEDMDILGL